jgi:hypothetical protein
MLSVVYEHLLQVIFGSKQYFRATCDMMHAAADGNGYIACNRMSTVHLVRVGGSIADNYLAALTQAASDYCYCCCCYDCCWSLLRVCRAPMRFSHVLSWLLSGRALRAQRSLLIRCVTN